MRYPFTDARGRARSFAALAGAAMLLLLGSRAGAHSGGDVIRVATIPSDISGEVYYAQDMGFFKKEGLNVTITPVKDGGTAAEAVSSHAMDIGYTGVFEVLNGRNKGLDLTIIAGANEHVSTAPSAALLSVLADSPIHTAKDLNGKTIAVNPLRGGTYIATRAWMDQNGGDSSTVHYIEMPLPLMAPAVKSGRVDAAEFVALADPNLGKPGDPFRVLACTFDAIAPQFVPSVWVTTDDWVKKHPQEARKFVAAMREAAIWANAHHAESAAILAKYTKLTVPQLQKVTRTVYTVGVTPKLIQPFIDAAVKYGVVPSNVPGQGLISAVAAAH